MTRLRARDEQELRRLLRVDERWRQEPDAVARWLNEVFNDHAQFLSSDEALWEVARERFIAMHGRTAGEPLLDSVLEQYTDLALQSARPHRQPSRKQWRWRLSWFAFGYAAAVLSLPVLVYAVGRRTASKAQFEIKHHLELSPAQVLEVVGDVRAWPRYDFPTTFNYFDKPTFSEATTGVGATVKVPLSRRRIFEGTITAVVPGRSVSYRASGGPYAHEGTITVTPGKTGSEVVWQTTLETSLLGGWLVERGENSPMAGSMMRSLMAFERQVRCEQ